LDRDLEQRIAQANGRLKVAEIKVSIERSGGWLCLRATFPPKPGTKQVRDSQQRLYLSIPANAAGVKVAENKARIIGAQLAEKRFDWSEYQKAPQQQPETVAAWIERFEKDYFSKRDRNFKTETTWQGDYIKIFRQLPPDQPLTIELMQDSICQTRADAKTRKWVCMEIAALAEFVRMEFDPSLFANFSSCLNFAKALVQSARGSSPAFTMLHVNQHR
jgi:hypothetical protein